MRKRAVIATTAALVLCCAAAVIVVAILPTLKVGAGRVSAAVQASYPDFCTRPAHLVIEAAPAPLFYAVACAAGATTSGTDPVILVNSWTCEATPLRNLAWPRELDSMFADSHMVVCP